VQVVRIFTDMSISPSLSLRQYPNRYAFRAGRNLLDKEFRSLESDNRFLRIVTTGLERVWLLRIQLAEPTALVSGKSGVF